jgi:hypothetical protein
MWGFPAGPNTVIGLQVAQAPQTSAQSFAGLSSDYAPARFVHSVSVNPRAAADGKHLNTQKNGVCG